MRNNIRLCKKTEEREDILFANTNIPKITRNFGWGFYFFPNLHDMKHQSCISPVSKIEQKLPVSIFTREHINLIICHLYC